MEDARISVYIFKDTENRKVSIFFYFTKQSVLPWGERVLCQVDGIYNIFKFKTKSKPKPSFSYLPGGED